VPEKISGQGILEEIGIELLLTRETDRLLLTVVLIEIGPGLGERALETEHLQDEGDIGTDHLVGESVEEDILMIIHHRSEEKESEAVVTAGHRIEIGLFQLDDVVEQE
jgi:hypothetical protein